MKINAICLLALAGAAAAAPGASSPGKTERNNEVRAPRDGSIAEAAGAHTKRFVWAIAEAGMAFLEYAYLVLDNVDIQDAEIWDPESGNCVVEIKARTNSNGATECSISSSPGGDPAFTEYTDWADCHVGAVNEFTFPDAPGRPSVGKMQVVWTQDGGPQGDGFWNPELGFLELNPPVFFQPDPNLREQGNVICNLETYEGSMSDEWSDWNSYTCGVPCRDAPDDFTMDSLQG